jgi:hypothetical protein
LTVVTAGFGLATGRAGVDAGTVHGHRVHSGLDVLVVDGRDGRFAPVAGAS